jgi:hypothetical protein
MFLLFLISEISDFDFFNSDTRPLNSVVSPPFFEILVIFLSNLAIFLSIFFLFS